MNGEQNQTVQEELAECLNSICFDVTASASDQSGLVVAGATLGSVKQIYLLFDIKRFKKAVQILTKTASNFCTVVLSLESGSVLR